MGKRRERWQLEKKSFWYGVSCSLAVLLLINAVIFSYAVTQGVTIQLDSEAMARAVQQQVISQAKQELPLIITEAKAEIPRIVEAEMNHQFSGRLEIAGFAFSLPEELMLQLRSKMRTHVENVTAQILDGINTQILAEQFGDNVYTKMKKTMSGEFNMKSFPVYIFGRIPLQLRLQVE
ncbi:MAG TPA: hypothetical protein DCE00_01540 [Firmicutes bacterium]|jgi:hypothetical protein|nr:hypothetical protein [Bacillota bacterium]HAA37536.1 hypothetical protein [Bacillota bacterium]